MPSLRFPDPSGRDLAQFVREAPSGAVIELAPGRFEGPLVVDRPLTIKGAGDLTRLEGDGRGPVVSIAVEDASLVYFESLAIEQGGGEDGGALAIHAGRVRLFNVLLRDCAVSGAGGGLWVGGGEVEARLLRLSGLESDLGGAVAVRGDASLLVHDGECRDAAARSGGALFVDGAARVRLCGVTFGRSRASATAGGQVICVGASTDPGLTLELERVRFEDAPLGQPLVVHPESPGRVVLFECDVPSEVAHNPGIVDAGKNVWR